MGEIYVSVDIEADGPCPGLNSMLSIGAAAFEYHANGAAKPHSTFSANLRDWPGATPDHDTMAWWSAPERAAAWEALRKDRQDPLNALGKFVSWLQSLPGKPIFVAYPASFDFTFVYWYLHALKLPNPFVRNAIDIETFVMGVCGNDYLQSDSKSWPPEWTEMPKDVHLVEHVAVDDAIEQGYWFMRMLRASRPPGR